MVQVNRRTFLQGVGGVALAGIAGRPTFAQSTPKRGGHLRVGLSGSTSQDTMDQMTWLGDGTWLLAQNVKNNLIEHDEFNKLTPALAESWEISPDATKFTFKLRKDVTFHSGKTLDAQDVIASINIHRADDTISPMKDYLKHITEIKDDGPLTVHVTLDRPNVDFIALMSSFNAGILPAKDGVVDRQTKDATGAYIIESFEPGRSLALKRNPNYWNGANAGFVETVEVVFIEDDAARMNAIRSGRVDIVNKVDLKTIGLMKRVRGIKVEDIKSGQLYSLPMMMDTPPFNDVNVRRALKYAINRQEMIDKVLYGYGTIGNDHPIAPSREFSNTSIPQTEYDPDKAKYYLKQAGLTQLEAPLSVSNTGFPGAVDTSALFQASAAAADIRLNVTREPEDGYFENVWLVKPFVASFWLQHPSVGLQFSDGYLPGVPWNETHCNIERVTKLITEAQGTIDDAKRGEMYGEIQAVLHDEGGVIVPAFPNYVWATRENVKHGPNVASNYTLDGLKFIQRWWLE